MAVLVCVAMVGGGRNIHGHFYENQFCSLRLPGCTFIAQCVDHIDPPDGPDDPRFWDKNNHQPACIHCNSVKGHRKIVGSYKVFGNDEDKTE